MYLPLAEMFINPLALFTIALGIGVLTRLSSPAGLLAVVPALTVFGMPPSFSVGTGIAHLFGRGIVSTFRENLFTGFDWRLGITLGMQAAAGVSLGKVVLLTLAAANTSGPVLRWLYVTVLLVAIAALFRPRAAAAVTSRQRSALIPFLSLGTGFLTGLAAVPVVLYLIPGLIRLGVQPVTARSAGTLAAILAYAWGTFTFAFGGRAEVLVALLLVVGTCGGSTLGALAARKMSRPVARSSIAAALFAVCAAVVLRHFGFTTPAGYLLWGAMGICFMAALIRALVGTPQPAPVAAPLGNNRY